MGAEIQAPAAPMVRVSGHRRMARTNPAMRWLKVRIPLLLLFAAVAAISFPTNEIFIVAAAIGSAAAFVAAYLQVFRLNEFRFSWVLADGLLLGYAFGALNTAMRLAAIGIPVGLYFSRPQADLSIALATAMLVSAVLFVFGAVAESPIEFNFSELKKSDFLFLCFGVLIVGAAFATGKLGFRGIAVGDAHRVTVLGELAGTLSPVLPALTVLMQPKCRSRLSSLLCWILLAATFAALVPQGRRVLLYGVLLVVLVFRIRGDARRLLTLKSGLTFAALLLLLYVANIFFYAMRVSTSTDTGNKMSLTNISERAIGVLQHGRDTHFDQLVAQNLRDRTFVLRYFSDLLAASWTHEPLYGQDAVFCLSAAIPSVLFPNKDKIRDIAIEENLANPQFGLRAVDEPNSILTTGLSDFGVVGAFIYPVLLVALMSLFVRSVTYKMPEGAKILIVLAVLNTMWQTEVGGGGYTVLCRNLLVVWVALVILIKVRATRYRDGGRRPASPRLIVKPFANPSRLSSFFGR